MRKPHSPFLASIYEQMLMLRYAMATVEAYLHWIKAFIRFSRMKHPVELGEAEVQQFLSYLVTERHVAVKTQAQALNALVFLYRTVLLRPLQLEMKFTRSQRPPKLPTVLTQSEVRALLLAMPVHLRLLAQLMYGSGLRLMEVMRLRVQDIDFNYLCLMVWNGKGGKHRRVTLASELIPALREQIAYVQRFYMTDCLNDAYAGVALPTALARKYPAASKELGWHYLFPGSCRWGLASTSSGSNYPAKSGSSHGASATAGKTGHLSYLAPFLCHPFAGAGGGYSNRAGATGPF